MQRDDEVRLGERSVRYRTPRPAVQDGIVYVTEDRKLEGFFETKSIAENIYTGLLGADLNRAPIVSQDLSPYTVRPCASVQRLICCAWAAEQARQQASRNKVVRISAA